MFFHNLILICHPEQGNRNSFADQTSLAGKQTLTSDASPFLHYFIAVVVFVLVIMVVVVIVFAVVFFYRNHN